MDEAALHELLGAVRSGEVGPDEAGRRLRRLPFADLGFARVDHHRWLRQGVAEAVYGPGKTPAQCAAIVVELLEEPGGPVLLTRAVPDQVDAALSAAPGGVLTGTTVVWRPAALDGHTVAVISAGTADRPVADECVATLAAYGFAATRLDDVPVVAPEADRRVLERGHGHAPSGTEGVEDGFVGQVGRVREHAIDGTEPRFLTAPGLPILTSGRRCHTR